MKPGAHVGRPSPADDDVPAIEHRRGLTTRHAERGRVLSAQRERANDPLGLAPRRRGEDPDRDVRT